MTAADIDRIRDRWRFVRRGEIAYDINTLLGALADRDARIAELASEWRSSQTTGSKA